MCAWTHARASLGAARDDLSPLLIVVRPAVLIDLHLLTPLLQAEE